MAASHPRAGGVVGIYSRESANRVVAAADLVFFIGTSAGGMPTHAWPVPKIGVPAIQIDIEAETIGRNYPVKVGILGGAEATLAALLKLSSNVQRSKWPEPVKRICG